MARVVSSLQANERDSTKAVVLFAAVIAALYFGAEILIPIALAILLSFVLAPMVRALHKVGLGRIAPVVITVVLAFAIIASLGSLIATQLKDLASDLPRYETTIVHKIQTVKGMSSGGGLQRVQEAISKLTKALDRSPQPAVATPGSANQPGPNSAPASEPASPAPLPVQVVAPAPGPIETLMRVAAPLLHPLATAGIVLIFVVFILMQREDLRNRAIRLFGANDLQRTTAAIDDGAKRLSRYLLTQSIVNACAGVVVGLSLWLIGVPSPILLGILFAIFRFIPYVGAVLGAMLPLLLAAGVDPGWSMAVWTVAVLVAIESVIGQVIEPLAYGHNTGLSPIAIVIAATFWTVLWGPVGLFLSTPLTVCLVVLGRHVDQLEFLDVLLGDQPPLSPPETFYQRMLAKDPIEASDQARKCLNEMSIVEYYDNVALPGLLLAQDDVGQDRLDPDRQLEIKLAALEVMEDLEPDEHEIEQEGDQPKKKKHFWNRSKAKDEAHKEATRPDDLLPDTAPEQFRAPGSVICIGARGPLDDVAAAMLAQVFQSFDIGARAESFTSLSKVEIQHLDVSGVKLICFSVLDGGSPAFLRFALRRLRRRAPGAQILLGAWWRRNGLRDTDDEIDEAVKEPKVSTLVDALRFCLSQTPAAGEAAPAQGTIEPRESRVTEVVPAA